MNNIHFWIELLSGFYNRYGYWIVFLGALTENTARSKLTSYSGSLSGLGGSCLEFSSYSISSGDGGGLAKESTRDGSAIKIIMCCIQDPHEQEDC